jgi:hypothetical protein
MDSFIGERSALVDSSLTTSPLPPASSTRSCVPARSSISATPTSTMCSLPPRRTNSSIQPGYFRRWSTAWPGLCSAACQWIALVPEPSGLGMTKEMPSVLGHCASHWFIFQSRSTCSLGSKMNCEDMTLPFQKLAPSRLV